MTELSQKIIEKYQVRKTGKQKAAFREMLMRELAVRGTEAREEEHKGLFPSINVVVGDPDTAEFIFGAHYDTCPAMFMPNFIVPCNKPVYFAYQMLVVAALLLISIIPAIPVGLVTDGRGAYLTWYFTYLLLFALMMKGPANPHTMNDNTSGVVALIELMERLPEEIRSRCAFVFFDNEEMHLLGSGAFRKAHGERMNTIPMINLDCVGDGGHLLTVASKAFREDERLYSALKAAFEAGGPVEHVPAEKAMYPSDQKNFKKSMAVAAMHKSNKIGYYLTRIHTTKDTILKEENIGRIAAGLSEMAEEYLK